MRGGDSERRTIPVRGCLSVAVGGPMRSPNPREGIHGAPRIARIARISAKRVCGDRRAIWLEAVHRWLLTRRRYKIIGLVWRLKFGDHCTKICQLALFQVDSQIKYHKQYYRQRDGFGANQVPETEADHGNISAHLPLVEIVEDSFSVLLGDGDPAFGLPLFPFESSKRIMCREAVGDKRSEQAFQELKHAVICVGASSSPSVFVKNIRGMAVGESSAEPVRYAGLFAPSGEKRQF